MTRLLAPLLALTLLSIQDISAAKRQDGHHAGRRTQGAGGGGHRGTTQTHNPKPRLKRPIDDVTLDFYELLHPETLRLAHEIYSAKEPNPGFLDLVVAELTLGINHHHSKTLRCRLHPQGFSDEPFYTDNPEYCQLYVLAAIAGNPSLDYQSVLEQGENKLKEKIRFSHSKEKLPKQAPAQAHWFFQLLFGIN